MCKEFVGVEIKHVKKRKAKNLSKETYPLVLKFVNVYRLP